MMIMANMTGDIIEKKKAGHIVDTHSSNTSIVLLGPRQGAGSKENMKIM